jgi:hypothetical protein
MYHPLTNSKFRCYQSHSPDKTKLLGLVREGCHFAQSFADSIEAYPVLVYQHALLGDTALFQVAIADPSYANSDDFCGIQQEGLITPFQSMALPSSVPADGSKVYRVRSLCYALIRDNRNKIYRA